MPRLVSAAGFTTALGGGTLPADVRRAMDEAASSTYRPDDLQRWASEAIAEATGAEAGWVTTGAEAALTLGAAACIAGTRLADLDRLPDARGAEIVVQRGHRNAYDRAFRSAGATIVEVGYPYHEGVGLTYAWQLEEALGERTVAVGHLACAEHLGLPLEQVCSLASAHDVPVIVDAAAELPPVANLRRFLDAGAALVAFSGGKAIRGPQGSGILAGRRDLIESVRLQTLDMDVDVPGWTAAEGGEPPHHGLGRSMKVGKEQIVGAVVALQAFVRRDHEAEAHEHGRWLETLRPVVAPLGEAEIRRDAFYPRLVLPGLGPRARELAERLAAGSPPVIVPHGPLRRGELVVWPQAISPDDRPVVEAALAALS
ncbi:MAG TPA: aminotransferase class V-fold PLP-dependent enzyme [Gaiellaceae bacterium]|nr:aminotransferase class V-fold PLP-dependent enzyme [Gaiellaceae bacterium]